jgi:DNA-binding MarR family transcriptional regulator
MVDRGSQRTFLVLRAIATFGGQWFGVADLATKTSLPRSTTHYQLAELVTQGVVEASKGKYRNRYASISLLVTVESITARLQSQGIEPTAETLACAIAHMRQAAALAADEALDDFIYEYREGENSA